MSERIGNHGWRIWKEENLPQEVVPLSDAEGVVATLKREIEATKKLLKQIREHTPGWNYYGQEIDALLTAEESE